MGAFGRVCRYTGTIPMYFLIPIGCLLSTSYTLWCDAAPRQYYLFAVLLGSFPFLTFWGLGEQNTAVIVNAMNFEATMKPNIDSDHRTPSTRIRFQSPSVYIHTFSLLRCQILVVAFTCKAV